MPDKMTEALDRFAAKLEEIRMMDAEINRQHLYVHQQIVSRFEAIERRITWRETVELAAKLTDEQFDAAQNEMHERKLGKATDEREAVRKELGA